MSTKTYADLKKAATDPARSWSSSLAHDRSHALKPDAERNGGPPAALAHDFGRIPLQTPDAATRQADAAAFQSCPLALSSPRACPFGGACHACPVQAKPRVSAPGDEFEREADRTADAVMRMKEPSVNAPPARQTVQPTASAVRASAVPPIVHDALRSPGQPLDAATRAFMEPRFGHDFSQVRVHADARAAESARALNALAYASGRDVVLGGGHPPASAEGRRLLAHELTHTVQQGATAGPAPAQGMVQRQAAPPVPRRTIWVNVGFDSSAQANETTMTKLRASIAAEKAAIASCCSVHSQACNIDVKTRYDWNRVNKPAPADGDYDSDVAADRTLRDSNLANIAGHAGGRRVLVTESTLSQTWQGARIFPRANTGASGILWNRRLAATDTIAHESGHAAGYTGDSEGGSHSSDPANLMSPGSIRTAGATPDANWCQQMAATAV